MNEISPRPRVLPVVILALLALAVVKAGDLWFGFSGADAAPANAEDVREAPAIVDASAPTPRKSDVEDRILQQLASRRAELDAREEAISTRETLLEIAEHRLEERFATLAAEETRLVGLKADSDRRQAEEFKALSNAYERMKPRDAARIFEVLENDILVPVAAGMRTQALAGVLSEMESEKARQLTRFLADQGRNERAALAVPQ